MTRDAEARLAVTLERAYTGGIERIQLESGRSLEVHLPRGMLTGHRIRLAGQGVEGGALYLIIDIQPHPLFRLEGSDIYCVLHITPSKAALGGLLEVPTLDGLVKISIPPGMRTGQQVRLASKGYLTEVGKRGDHIVEVQIVVLDDPSL